MAKIIDGKIVNTEKDNKFVEEWFLKASKIKVKIKETGEEFFLPLATVSTKLDMSEVGSGKQ